ncbi:hypothetical protein ACFTWH_17270 [Streptomyces sp. NPDC057011]|uniref:hypothetical protein n=1 Tax=unclassified Streptomyces TaxID=2593676 RepID=UPI00362E255A
MPGATGPTAEPTPYARANIARSSTTNPVNAGEGGHHPVVGAWTTDGSSSAICFP